MKSNRVVFVRALLAAGVIVAAGCDSKSTPLTATNPPLTITVNPCSPGGTLTLAVATAARIDCSGGGTTLTVAGGGASYMIVPQFPTDQANLQYIGYQLFTGTVATTSASVSMSRLASARNILSAAGSRAAAAPPHGRKMFAQFAMEKARRTRMTQRSRSSIPRSARTQQLNAGRSAIVSPPPVGTLRTFHVASSLTGDGYTTVGARVAYIGANVLVYLDTLAPQAPNGFTPAQLSAFGLLFDQTLYPIDTSAFGSPTDLDNNGRVIMLMSPAVNAEVTTAECNSEGFVEGFFDPGDFDNSNPNSNQGEIFYSIVPDVSGQFSCAHSLTDVDQGVPATFMHELQHLINYSQHVVFSAGDPFSSWMDEGMSIVAEELGSVYYEQKCPYPQASCRTGGAGQFFPDSSQGFVEGFLYDSYEYALLPDTATITLSNDSENGFSWRGGAWLFTRWFSDQMGSGVLRQLERGPADALTAVQQISGQSFPALFSNFGLALYTDSLPGLARTTAPAVDRFVSRNVKFLWTRTYANYGPASDVPTATPLQLFPITNDTTTSVLLPGTMTFFRLDTPASSPTVTIQFSQPGGLAFPPVLAPQMAIFRLPPGQ